VTPWLVPLWAILTVIGLTDEFATVSKGAVLLGEPELLGKTEDALPTRRLETGGEGGIRTLGRGLSPYDGLANRCFRPLSHLSVGGKLQVETGF
jgi:hypothetical protein